jgi:hypothetical protein
LKTETKSDRFENKLLPKLIRLEKEEIDGHRFYKYHGRYLPSVTTKLGAWGDKSYLEAWKARIGADAARRAANQGKRRGSQMHKICEDYILGDPAWKKAMPSTLESFLKIKPYIDNKVSRVYGVEYFLYNPGINTAGTTDLICKWDGKPVIVDFKTARNHTQRKMDKGLLHSGHMLCLHV